MLANNDKQVFEKISVRVSDLFKQLRLMRNSSIQLELNSSISILEPYIQNLERNLDSLKNDSEWNTFVMAFYGETNAGKSTIIEALRILLKEESKKIEQEKFFELQKEFNLTTENISTVEQSVVVAYEEIKKCDEEIIESERRKVNIEAKDKEEFENLVQKIIYLKKVATIWQKIVMIFKKMPEIKELEDLRIRISENKANADKDIEISKKKKAAAEKVKLEADLAKAKVEENLVILGEFADGSIIGNGRSDFTLKTKEYKFETSRQKFILLDVPGIEGDEKKVIDNVNSAVRKAHAVFYVTGKAAPPQSGDNENRGTLEKIKDHLDSQSEVWSIYNKRVTNPIQIENGLNISADENESLSNLDLKMQEQLGVNYKKTIPISAYPAFLAAAKFLTPNSHHAKGREKFLKRFTGQEILEKTKMQDFYKFIANDLVKNSESKIFSSNYFKAKVVVENTINGMEVVLKEKINPLEVNLSKECDSAKNQLKLALDSLKSRLFSVGDFSAENFVESVREKMYIEIKKDISNDDFKEAFERCIKNHQSTLTQNLPTKVTEETNIFREKISSIVSRYKELADETIRSNSTASFNGNQINIDLKIDLKNGIQMSNLAVAAIGAAMMAWNPAGWAVMALGALTILVSIVKAVRSFFSSDYKMSQQRESVNENLSNIRSDLHNSLRNSLDSVFLSVENSVDEIFEEIDKPLDVVRCVRDILNKIVSELDQLKADIEKNLPRNLLVDESSPITFSYLKAIN